MAEEPEIRTLDSLPDAKYKSGFEGLALSERGTHPGSHGFPDATFDFIFARGLTASQPTVSRTNASDHRPVTRSLVLHESTPAPARSRWRDLSSGTQARRREIQKLSTPPRVRSKFDYRH
jgi:hypothetical protein